MIILGICKAKDLILAITKAWFDQTELWQFDETDIEIINSWRN